ncbi:MAG: AAA family ATPase [candidate division WOR-3 bacterium]
MIRRLQVDGYKSLKNLEIDFSDGVTLFVGPNAAGKSNIIDLIKLIAATAGQNCRYFKHFWDCLTSTRKMVSGSSK